MESGSFDEAALSSLTQKISEKLTREKPWHHEEPFQSGRQLKRKPKKHQEEAFDGQKSTQTGRNYLVQQSFKHSTKHASTTQKDKSYQGNKRLRNGELKSATNASTADAGISSGDRGRGRLLEEIVELGGTEDDLNLVEDAESGSEVEGAAVSDTNLPKDVRRMVQELGLPNLSAVHEPEDISDGDSVESSESNQGDSEEGVRLGHESTVKRMRDSSGLLFDPLAEWFSVELSTLPDISESTVQLPKQTVEALHQRGKDLLHIENENFSNKHRSSSSSHHFYSTVIKSGTLTDKISALTLLVQESPLHNVKALDTLVGLAKKRSRAQAIEVLTALKDLYSQGSLLPSSRHLCIFTAQPGLMAVSAETVQTYNRSLPAPQPLTDAHLLSWAFEDWLKGKYFETLQVLETWSNDEIAHSRSKAVDMIFELLRDKPEQEANLLRLLVNKLGDSEKKIASRASYNLLQLQGPHPMMKDNIVSGIESNILFRPGQSLHAKYYAVITLNQTILSTDELPVVKKLLSAYFGLFRSVLASLDSHPEDVQSIVNKKGQIQGGGGQPGKMAQQKKAKAAQKGASVEEAMREKIISAVLTGINRALPYTDTEDEFYEKHLDTLFKITHSSNFNTSIQAMLLMQQLCTTHQAAHDRFYRTLYESLLDPRLLQSSKQILYLNLLYRALKSDLNPKRVQAFGKRLLQVVAMHQPSFVCAVIYLLRELEGNSPALATFIDQPEERNGEEDERSMGAPGASEQVADRAKASITPDNGTYDGKKRAPEFSHADRSCLWELDPLQYHFHPSASKFAHELMTHGAMPSKPSLESHTLMQFLDRFVYRNPKKHPNKWHGASIMQPLAASDSRGQLLHTRSAPDKFPVNAEAFSRLRDEDVSADDIFFHKYFKTMAQGNVKGKTKKEKKEKKRAGSEDSDEAEDEVWQALVDSKPDIEGSEDDMDIDMDDLSDMDDSDLGAAMDDLSDGSWSDRYNDVPDAVPTAGMAASAAKSEKGSEGDGAANSSRNRAARKRRRELKSLPTFASAEDYTAMVENIEGEELGM